LTVTGVQTCALPIYVSDFSTVTDARTANTAVFYPGTGRAFYAGLRYQF